MLLALDVGNSHIVLGAAAKGRFLHHWRVATDTGRTADEYGIILDGLLRTAGVGRGEISSAALASVVPPVTDTLREAIGRYLGCRVLVVGRAHVPRITVEVDAPESVGVDRLINLVAARRRSEPPLIVVDFGTATTFDALRSDGAFIGGAIAPGLGIAADALIQHTALLPRFPLRAPDRAIGTNTITNLQSGLVYGYAGLVDGLVTRFQGELGSCRTVIATGGLAEVIAPHSATIRVVAPLLTLEGLALIHEHAEACAAGASS